MTALIKLDREQQILFTEYCRQEAKFSDERAKQMETLSIKEMMKREKSKAVAFIIVANEIGPANWESVTVEG